MKTSYIVCGSPGSGKSTYARHLASLKYAMVLDIDTVTEPLVQLALENSGRSPDDRDSGYFKKTYRQPIYETLFSIARENLSVLDVIIVGPFTKELRDPEWPSKLEETLSGPVEVHYVQCPPGTCKQRLEKRSKPRDLAKLSDWGKYTKYYGGEILPAFDHILVDGTRLCRKTPSSARERAVFSPGKDGEAGDVGFIVDTVGSSQADNCGCLDPTVAATAAVKTIQEKEPLEARPSFPTEPNIKGSRTNR